MTDASTIIKTAVQPSAAHFTLLPLIAEQALSVTIGLADTLMVSSVGEAAVSGVSLVDSFNTLMIQIMSALATGGAVVTSQYIGHQGPQKRQGQRLRRSCSSDLAQRGGGGVVWSSAGGTPSCGASSAPLTPDVMHYAETYFLLSALSYPSSACITRVRGPLPRAGQQQRSVCFPAL